MWYNFHMEMKFTEEQINSIPEQVLRQMFLTQQDSFDKLSKQNDSLMRMIEELQLQIKMLTTKTYGRKTDKCTITSDQLNMFSSNANFINEAEAEILSGVPEEPAFETVTYTRRKTKGKRDEDLSLLRIVVEKPIELSDEILKEKFPYGYTRLADEIYRDVEHIPEEFVVHEHHIAVYAGKRDYGVIRADKPERLLKNSILTPSLAAAVFDMKYANCIPFNRICEDFKRKNIMISRQVMAGWMIKLTERYLWPLYNEFHKEILKSKLIHCDETPFVLINNGRGAGTKDYMWVYHTCEKYGSHPIFVYEYQPGRSREMPKEFLGDYKGYLVTDGYQVYHSISKERPDELIVAGCWAHCKRRFSEIYKNEDKKLGENSTASEAVTRIMAIYHVDNMTKGKDDEERLRHRKQSVKPLVDDFFAWLKKVSMEPIDKSSKLSRAINYALNQEPYLRTFLTNGMIPMDNNDAERSIKGFCVFKHSCNVIDSTAGAETSGKLFSIAETAKANGLKPYEYFKYVLEFILNHQDDAPSEYMDKIVPWSSEIPEGCRKTK